MSPYLNNYTMDFEKSNVPYSLRPHPLHVPRMSHSYTEAELVYQLVVMQNIITASGPVIYNTGR